MANRNIFNSVQLKKPNKNVFDLSNDHKLSLNLGELVPVFVRDCVPGDIFKIGCDTLLRFAPLVAPVMHRLDQTVHYFFVPNRILWDGWEDFITGESEDAPPTVGLSAASYSPLLDYLGLPTPTGDNEGQVSALPLAAYQLICNEYYRDQNLITEYAPDLTPGPNAMFGLNNLRRRAWAHDYFTAALPFAQKGQAVDIPLGDVQLKPNWITSGTPHFMDQTGSLSPTGNVDIDALNNIVSSGAPGDPMAYDPQGTLTVQATTISDLRRAAVLQQWLEKNALGGTRYVENILIHFGERSQDSRLDRPEYITGLKSPVVISEVLNTAGPVGDDPVPQGNMSGHGISVASGKYAKYKCHEHGYIIGILSVMPLPAYQQGVPHHFIRRERFDFLWPSFAHIGEQPVENQEIYFNQPNKTGVFGYVPRYAEYRYNPSQVSGDFKTSLDFWHFGRIFATPPALNQTFIECDPDPRPFAVTDPNVDKIYAHVYNRVHVIRPLPKFGTPAL